MPQSRQRSGRPAAESPTYKPPQPPGLAPVLERNREALPQRGVRESAAASFEERIAERITHFCGSMTFVYLHLAIYGFWIIANLVAIPGVPHWDPSFVALAMVASVEAIFLSTFVLITQNRMAAAADKRASLDLQISLLAEHEITKVAAIVSAMAARMGVETEVDAELDQIKQDVAPDAVLDKMSRKAAELGGSSARQARGGRSSPRKRGPSID
jgi:uncharacterized membrane protein